MPMIRVPIIEAPLIVSKTNRVESFQSWTFARETPMALIENPNEGLLTAWLQPPQAAGDRARLPWCGCGRLDSYDIKAVYPTSADWFMVTDRGVSSTTPRGADFQIPSSACVRRRGRSPRCGREY